MWNIQFLKPSGLTTMHSLLRASVLLFAVTGTLFCAEAEAQIADEVFLNFTNTSVMLGDLHNGDSEPFANRTTLDSLISLTDAPSADAEEFHRQSTHVWVSGGMLEVVFEFDNDFDLTQFHFWNYHSESFDVDDVDLVFLDSEMNTIGTMEDISPALGNDTGFDSTPTLAEDFALDFEGVRYVRATFAGSNDQVDFNNMGFTGSATEVEPVLLGDVNTDGLVNFFDIDPFISLLASETFQIEADMNLNGIVSFSDIAPFIEALSSTGSTDN